MFRFSMRLALAVSLVCGGAAWAEKIKFSYSDVESELYQLGNGPQMANPPGAAIELLNLAAKDLGHEIEYTRLPAKRLMESLQQGDVDGAFMFSFRRAALGSWARLTERRLPCAAHSRFPVSRAILPAWSVGARTAWHSAPRATRFS